MKEYKPKTISERIEEELLTEVIRPAISTNSLHFDILLRELKDYYNNAHPYSFPDRKNWERLLREFI